CVSRSARRGPRSAMSTRSGKRFAGLPPDASSRNDRVARRLSATACEPNRSLLESEDSGEVVPLEEDVHGAKPDMPQHLFVLLQSIGQQHVLECFALSRDLDLTVAVALFE